MLKEGLEDIVGVSTVGRRGSCWINVISGVVAGLELGFNVMVRAYRPKRIL